MQGIAEISSQPQKSLHAMACHWQAELVGQDAAPDNSTSMLSSHWPSTPPQPISIVSHLLALQSTAHGESSH